jgi:hypothetical protein
MEVERNYFEGGARARQDPGVELRGQSIFIHILKNSVSVYRTSEVFKEPYLDLSKRKLLAKLSKVQVKHPVPCCLSYRNQHSGHA